MDIAYSIFPKFYAHLDPAGLAGLVRHVGLDTVNLVIRDGYWVSKAGMKTELPAFIAAMRAEDLKVEFATAGFSVAEIEEDDALLGILAENGIREFRMDYFRMAGPDVRGALVEARAALERLAPICARHGVRAVYQVHHNTLVPGPSMAWHLFKGLPAAQAMVEAEG